MKEMTYSLTDPQKTIMSAANLTMRSNKLASSNVILDFYFKVNKNCNFEALEKAYQYVMRNNDSLRLYFFRKGLSTVQKILPWENKEIEKVVLNEQSEFDEFFDNIDKYEVKIMNNNPIRCFLVQVKDSGILVFRVHHLLLDAFSVGIIFKQLEKVYTNELEGIETPDTNVSIEEFFQKNKKYHSGKIKDDRKYWASVHLHQKNFKPIFPWKSGQENITSNYVIDGERYEKLMACHEELCEEMYLSLESLVSYLVGLTIFKLSKHKCFAITNIAHGRRSSKMQRCVGCMMESIPTYFDFNDGQTLEEALNKYNENYLNGMLHGQLPLAEHLVMIAPSAIINGFNFQHFWWMDFSSMDYEKAVESSEFTTAMRETQYMGFPYYLGMYTSEDAITMKIEHQKKRFPKEMTDKYWQCFLSTIDRFVENRGMLINVF